MPTILGANTSDPAYEIANSLRFDGSTSRIDREFSQDPTSRKTFTISIWVKRSNLGANTTFFNASTTNNFYDQALMFDSNDNLRTINVASGSDAIQVITNRKFRDVAAWYHIVLAIDTTEAAVADGVKFYINGVQETSFSTTTYTQNATYELGRNGSTTAIGRQQLNGTQYFDGYMAEINYIDGQQLDSSYFGETNDNGVWVPKQYTGTYGNNGFFLEFKQTGTSENSSGIGADTSGNDEHFAVANLAATDVTTDTPTNNFCTMNPLMSFAGASDGIDAFSEGNTVVDSNNDTSAAGSTFGVKNGKWYYEAKLITGDQSSTNFSTGWCQVDYEGQKGTGNGVGFMSGEDNASMDVGGNIIFNNSGSGNQATFGNRSTNDIFQVAVDLDNNKMWFGVNGTWSNGSASQSTTFDASNSDFSSIFDTAGVDYMPAFAQSSTGQTVLAYNFGNPSYSISSGNADANGYGNFEYAVPSGFYSLCTKNLAEYG